ncbi:MAG: hypothetical protein AVDCRST_MAG33-3376 [uncultured Thermomicrobiales bacterium]|uniref:Uncharacterized protein n=1 Tax=uncultured Thermomicrobiales bacterium TaxID=1645740 RepID=A0A6J4VHD0_9BACT|nr:MAG: hypothetical protein AVDCRST_MAG33-3376 [uncultured Thermomicrobiales bacterium]
MLILGPDRDQRDGTCGVDDVDRSLAPSFLTAVWASGRP